MLTGRRSLTLFRGGAPSLGGASPHPDEARRIAANIAKLAELLRRKPGDRPAQPRKPVLRSFLPQGPRQGALDHGAGAEMDRCRRR
jgi:hypothetical protein